MLTEEGFLNLSCVLYDFQLLYFFICMFIYPWQRKIKPQTSQAFKSIYENINPIWKKYMLFINILPANC